jgi:hypothetical protein
MLYIEGSMLINSFMLGKAGISCLEMPEQAMNLNIWKCLRCTKLQPAINYFRFYQLYINTN